MNKTVTITSKNHKYQNTYGGYIGISDYCSDYERNDKSRSWAERIASDWKFDSECEKHMENSIGLFRMKQEETA